MWSVQVRVRGNILRYGRVSFRRGRKDKKHNNIYLPERVAPAGISHSLIHYSLLQYRGHLHFPFSKFKRREIIKADVKKYVHFQFAFHFEKNVR